MKSSERLVVTFMMNPEIRSKIKSYIEPWFFESNLLRSIVDTLLDDKFDGKRVNKTAFLVSLSSKNPNMLDRDISEASKIFDEYEAGKEDLDYDQAISSIVEFIKDSYRAKAVSLYSEGDPEKGDFYYSKVLNFGLEGGHIIDPSSIEDVKKSKQQDSISDSPRIKSTMALINDSLLYGGYKAGDLIMVCAAPKAGKSSFLVQEGANFIKSGVKVLHYFIGDMSAFDGIVRYLSNLSGAPQAEVIENTEKYVEEYRDFMANLRIGSVPAMSLTIYEILSESRKTRNDFPFSVLVLDYDSNILVPKSESLYETGGILYSTLKGFAQKEQVLVMIASQPKIQYWDNEILSGTAAAESSRKQAAVDVMITLGRNPVCRRVGTMYVPYVRRGSSGNLTRLEFFDEVCRVKQIDNDRYKQVIENYNNEALSNPVYVDLLISDGGKSSGRINGKSKKSKD